MYPHTDAGRSTAAYSSRGPGAAFSGLQDTPKAQLGSGMGLGSLGSALAGGGNRAVAFDTRSSVLGMGPGSTYDRRDGGGGGDGRGRGGASWDSGAGIRDRDGGEV